MSDHNDDRLVADYLRRLTSAASALPADRRTELIEEITAHIAEARTAGPASLEGQPSPSPSPAEAWKEENVPQQHEPQKAMEIND